MRRHYQEPLSLTALWSLRVVLTGLAVLAVVAVATRLDALDGLQSMIGIGIGLAVVLTGLALALIAGGIIWQTGRDGARYAVYGGVLASLALAGPALIVARAASLPAIHDISTDLSDVPEFVVAAAVRPPNANSAQYGGDAVARQQKQAYPAVKPLLIDIAAGDIDELLDEIVRGQTWLVLARTPFRGAEGEGRVEAVARSPVLGLRDDIVIRTRDADGRVRVDMRSASRYGSSDLGANARRISSFLDDLRLAARQQNQ